MSILGLGGYRSCSMVSLGLDVITAASIRAGLFEAGNVTCSPTLQHMSRLKGRYQKIRSPWLEVQVPERRTFGCRIASVIHGPPEGRW